MAIIPNPHKTTGFVGWIDDRFPMTKLWRDHISEYYAPKNFNWWYTYGSLALLVLVNQLLTGIFLTMHYKPDAAQAWHSVEYIMRDVPWGNVIRYLHSTGASAFFIVRLVPQAARADLAVRRADLPVPDGRSVLRLRAALGPDVVLGRAGDHLAVRRDPGDRPGPGDLDPGRLHPVRRDAQPSVLAARRRAAVRARRPRHRAPDGAA
jgi:hypothetical protein